MPRHTIDQVQALAYRALRNAGASEAMATSTARALAEAEAQGMPSHGLSRIGQYTTHLRNGRADGNAVPAVVRSRGGAALIDAGPAWPFPPARWRWTRRSRARASMASPSPA